jgi:hypothetical protein
MKLRRKDLAFVAVCTVAAGRLFHREAFPNLLPSLLSGDRRWQSAAAVSTRQDRLDSRKIPRRLLFTYMENLLRPDLLSRNDDDWAYGPGNLARNVNRTIRMFHEAWASGDGEDDFEVSFLTDEDCAKLINETEPRLLVPFLNESEGCYKSDICRVVALWQTGGYYLDNDLVVVRVPELPPRTEFATVAVASMVEFFQAFLAVAPRHPILNISMQVMIDYYEGSHDLTDGYQFMGTSTMREAFVRYAAEHPEKADTIRFFHERSLSETPRLFPNHPREPEPGPCCKPKNYVVFEAESDQLLFESRITKALLERYGLDVIGA